MESGGDGALHQVRHLPFRNRDEGCVRALRLDLGESANWYVQGSWAQAENASDWIQWVVSPNDGRPNTLFANNPYLTPATQALLGRASSAELAAATGRRCLPAVPPTSPQTGSTPPPPPTIADHSSPLPSLHLERGRRGARRWQQPEPAVSHARRSEAVECGNRHHRRVRRTSTWEVYYNHSNSELTVTNPNNTDNAKYLASLDAVNDGGTIRCWVEHTAAVRRSLSGLRADPTSPIPADFGGGL